MVQATLLSGKRGEGKSLSALRMIYEYVQRGCTVATNMDLIVDKLCGNKSKLVLYRLPDFPTATDMQNLPLGNSEPTNESKNGLLVLDEAGTFLNSRTWNSSNRGEFINWLLHSRKYGWDLLLIAQHPRLVDAQIRDGLCDIFATAKRLDKIRIPFIGLFLKLLHVPFRLPRAHIITFRYGFGANAPISDTWFFTGSQFYDCYDSLQRISGLNTIHGGVSCYLPGWHLRGRYMSWFDLKKGAIIGVSFLFALIVGIAGFFVGVFYVTPVPDVASVDVSVPVDSSVTVIGLSTSGLARVAVLSDGRVLPVQSESFTDKGRYFVVAGKTYRGGF
jgi:hypothetical protein